jgi:hypothetical protein
MKIVRAFHLFLLLGAGLLTLPSSSIADTVEYQFTLNTAPLVSSAAGPFSLDFQLNDGSGTNDGNNTATLSNFSFGAGGAPVGAASLIGGASGNLSSTVQIKDSSFLNDFTQGFTAGNTLSFTLNLTTNVDTRGAPDEFTFAILDNTGSELPTRTPLNVFSLIDVTAKLHVQTFGSDPNQVPVAGGTPLDTGAPTAKLIPPSTAPEPTSIVLLAAGLLLLVAKFKLFDRLNVRAKNGD